MAENQNKAVKRTQINEKLRKAVRTNFRYNIGVKFFSFIVLVALLSGGIVGLVTVKNSRDYLRQQALNNNLNQAALAAAFASNYIQAIEAHAEVFATRPDITQAVFNGTAGQLQATLATFVQIQTPLNGVGIYDTNGIQLVFSLAGSTTVGQSFADRNWFQGAMNTGKPYLGTPILAKANNVPVETYAVPILDDQGKIRAVLSAGISLQKLSAALVAIGFTTDTQAILIDLRNGGLIIADKDPTLLLTVATGDPSAVDRLIAGKNGVLETTGSGGKPDLTGFAAVPDLPWGIMVVTPSSTALSILNTLTQRAIIYGLIILVAACVFGMFLILGITRPLNKLVQETKEIGSGNLDVEAGSKAKDEIGDLSRAFSDMTVKLKSTMVSRDELLKEVAERRRAEESAKENEAQLRAIFDATPFPVALVDVQDNNIYLWSRSALTLFGHTAPTASEWYEIAYPDPDYRRDVIERWKPALEKARLSGHAINTGEYRVTCRDGSVRICELYASFLANRLIVTFNDITERKQLEDTVLSNTR
jgi:PAS domain S-box-containing protein